MPCEKAIDCFSIIVNRYPFVYKICNKYYLIGNRVFQECTGEQIELYNSILNEYSNLKDNVGIENKKHTSEIVILKELFDYVKDLQKQGAEIDSKTEKEELERIAKYMSDDDVLELQNQIETYGAIASLTVLFETQKLLEEENE